MFRLLFFSILALCLSPVALAAPQVMGVVATAEPVPMQCAGGRCTALLSAFCLQEDRLPPDFDTAYRPSEPGLIVLVAGMANGTTVRFEGGEILEFRSRYGYTSVEAQLPLKQLSGMTPTTLALEINPLAVLLPVPKADDRDPLSDREIAIAAGPWRLAAANVMEGDGETAVAARDTMRLINTLPISGDIGREERRSLWRRTAGEYGRIARQVFDACSRTVDSAVGYRLRRCLEERHEILQVRNTREFWRSLGGS